MNDRVNAMGALSSAMHDIVFIYVDLYSHIAQSLILSFELPGIV